MRRIIIDSAVISRADAALLYIDVAEQYKDAAKKLIEAMGY